jgi:hypothetical protein
MPTKTLVKKPVKKASKEFTWEDLLKSQAET